MAAVRGLTVLVLVRGYRGEKRSGRFSGNWVTLVEVSKVVRLTSLSDGLGGEDGGVRGDLSVCDLLSWLDRGATHHDRAVVEEKRLNTESVRLLEKPDFSGRSNSRASR